MSRKYYCILNFIARANIFDSMNNLMDFLGTSLRLQELLIVINARGPFTNSISNTNSQAQQAIIILNYHSHSHFSISSVIREISGNNLKRHVKTISVECLVLRGSEGDPGEPRSNSGGDSYAHYRTINLGNVRIHPSSPKAVG